MACVLACNSNEEPEKLPAVARNADLELVDAHHSRPEPRPAALVRAGQDELCSGVGGVCWSASYGETMS